MRFVSLALSLLGIIAVMPVSAAHAQWVTRDSHFQLRGSWNWALQRELNDLYREFNGIDFGHAHLAETLLKTQDEDAVEKARIEVLDFIFTEPSAPPDEDQVSPAFTRMAWEVRRTFDWTHIFHRSLYDLFASDDVADKRAEYRRILDDYLAQPEAITPHHLDHHGKLWSFPESKTFRDTFPKFNSQIWAYHWLQAAAYDVQLAGSADVQRELMPKIIAHYHGYLREPPVEWQMMPMMKEAAPAFTEQFPEAAAIFDNLHMLHDNVDDILCRPDLYPTRKAQRKAMLHVLDIYLHRNHEPVVRYPQYHMTGDDMQMDHAEHNRPPSASDVLEGRRTPAAAPESADGAVETDNGANHGDHH